MPKKLSLSRAARLANVSRGDLQARLRDLELNMFEGEISVADLLKAYPEIDMERDPVLERVALVREEAFSKRGRKDSSLPDPEVLMARLHDFQTVLMKTKASLDAAEELVRELRRGLEQALQEDTGGLRERIEALSHRLGRALPAPNPAREREAALFAKDVLLSLISATVKLLPSGHDFFVAGQDSILEAAVKSGLHLKYGCASGNCGSCKVKLLSGRVRKIRDYDYVLSAAEQEKGYILSCSHTAVTDLLIEAQEAHAPEDLPRQSVRAVVRKQLPIDDELTLLQVQTPRTQTLRFMAGQRVRLTSDDGIARELPIASCPCDARNLQFLLRGGTDDPLRASLAAHQTPTLLIEGPFGDFLLQEESSAPAIFLSVADGVAPIKSLVEHAIAIDRAVTLHLFRIDDIPAGSQIGNLYRSWHDALDNLSYTRLTQDTNPREALAALLQRFPRLSACRLYVAAPKSWLEEFRQALGSTADLAPEGVHLAAVD
jgi:CDP-4-dehydro-6-deoxyglucose reductase